MKITDPADNGFTAPRGVLQIIVPSSWTLMIVEPSFVGEIRKKKNEHEEDTATPTRPMR
jgi:hypothetical protein